MSVPEREAVELFLQEASEHLQYLREYVSVLQEIEPRREDLERLYIAAHTLSGTSASYGFPRFSEIAGKLAHVFQYSLNATLGEDLHGPLTEFLSDGISLLETDLLEISDTGNENAEDITAFKERYRFAFPVEPVPLNFGVTNSGVDLLPAEAPQAGVTGSYFDALPSDDEVGPEILEYFQPEAEEHLQVVSDCLISLEGNNNPEEINRLFRAIHTVKGSAAQVGLKRLGAIAHRVEDLIGRLRDGEIEPSPAVVDICLESVDVLKKTLHQQWADESEMRNGVDSLLNRIAEFAPVEIEEAVAGQIAATESLEPVHHTSLHAGRRTQSRQANRSTRSIGKIRPHRARTSRPHDEHGRRARHQPHPHGWARHGTRKARRYSELLEGASAGQSQRVPGKIRIQQNQLLAQFLVVASGHYASAADERCGWWRPVRRFQRTRDGSL